jgi:hypothetical protein
MILPYFLGGLLLASIIARSFRSFRTIFILFADWTACTTLAEIIGSQTNWIGLSAIDGMAAILLLGCRRRMEAALAVSFIAEIIMHLAYGFHEVFHLSAPRADVLHWWLTFVVAWGQALGFVVWGCWHGRRRLRSPDRLRRVAGGELRPASTGHRDILPPERNGAGG